jgi:hypothetical protein
VLTALSQAAVMGLPSLCDETQKLLASTFFFFVRSTPLAHPLSAVDPMVFAFRTVELLLKGFRSKGEMVKALNRLDQRRNFARLLESLARSDVPQCAELADSFGFLKSLPKGEAIARHLPAPLSVVACAASPIIPLHGRHHHNSNNGNAAAAVPASVSSTSSSATPRSGRNKSGSAAVPAIFTDVTREQVAWVARCTLAHFYMRADSHCDLPRSTSAVFSSSIDPAVVQLAGRKKRVAGLKRSALMAPWRVLLLAQDEAAGSSSSSSSTSWYPATTWTPCTVGLEGASGAFVWNDVVV